MGRNLRGIISITIVLLAGCGKNGDTDSVVRVQGKVTLRNAALNGGTLAFVPDIELGGNGDLVVAEIGKDGSYSLMVAPGWYRITIQAAPEADLSPCYADPELCKLSCEVKAGSINTHDLSLN